MASKKDNIRPFLNVKIYGYDPNHEPDQYGYYSVTIYISQEQKDFIDNFLFGKTDVTKDGEILYRAKSKKKIPFTDMSRNEINTGVETFIGDVSLLFDEFHDKEKDTDVRYIKPLMIRYKSLVPNEPVRIFIKQEFTYDDCFPEESNEPQTQPDFSAMRTKEEIVNQQAVTPSPASTFEPTIPPMDDLPF